MGGGRNLTPQPLTVQTHDYCVTNGLYVQRRAGVPEVAHDDLTHLSLAGWAGGRIKMDDPAHERGFLQKYARDLDSGCKDLSYVELKTRFFPFFMDIDVRCTIENGPPTGDQMRQLVTIALGAVAEFVPAAADAAADGTGAADLTAYVCDTLPSTYKDSAKFGCHIHVPAVVVDAQTARTIRELVIRRAHEQLDEPLAAGLLPFTNSIEDIYDEVVYLANGLRMVGSVKYTPCRTCRRTNDCPECGGVGKIKDTVATYDADGQLAAWVGRTYELTRVLRHRGGCGAKAFTDDAAELARLRARTYQACHDMVRRLSIRTTETEVVGWLKVPAHAEMPRLAIVPTKRAKTTKVFDLYPEDVSGLNRQVTDFREVDNAETLSLLRRVLDEVIVPADLRREGIRLKRARWKQGMYMLYVVGPGSTLCGNMPNDGMHRSNSIYFVVTPAGAEQRCFCTCTGVESRRVHGVLCKSYRAPKLKLGTELRSTLFPMETLERDRARDMRRWERAAATLERSTTTVEQPGAPNDNPTPDSGRDETAPVATRVTAKSLGPRAPRRSRPPSQIHKRTLEDPAGAKHAKRYKFKMFNLAAQQLLARGRPAERTRTQRVNL